ncbi:MAG TPA: hypothetical protein VMF66_16795 [Candidatus Acidoferrum sp.]|nr:hypothetical protein [Candidatus Acidoferrum sp.]
MLTRLLTMTLRYQSGEEIMQGDLVTYHGGNGEVELLADPQSENLSKEQTWFVEEYGGGIMIRGPKVYGRVFIGAAQIPDNEDLVFVSRSPQANRTQKD